jgi:hypothetical protein
MKFKARVIEFKSVSPLFEMERDGTKPFTTRLVDYQDPRFRALVQWRPDCLYDPGKLPWYIKETNPATGEYFYRELIDVIEMPEPEFTAPEHNAAYKQLRKWLILYLGKGIKEE